jgi:hypothetical protein
MLTDKIKTLQSKLKCLVEEKKALYQNIKAESKVSYFHLTNEHIFRYALCLLHSKYYEKYDLTFEKYNYSIEPSKDWDTKEYQNYYNIRYKIFVERRNIGFICFKKDLKHAIDLKALWKHRVSKHNLTISLQEFIDGVDKMNLFDMFSESISEKTTLELIHEPKLGIDNTVILLRENEKYTKSF